MNTVLRINMFMFYEKIFQKLYRIAQYFSVLNSPETFYNAIEDMGWILFYWNSLIVTV